MRLVKDWLRHKRHPAPSSRKYQRSNNQAPAASENSESIPEQGNDEIRDDSSTQLETQ